MKKITIKITGSGTRKDVSKALKQIAREILALSFENHSIHTLEDDVLIAEVTEDEEEELFKRAIRVACGKVMYDDGESDFLDCYKNLKEYSKTHASWMATAADIPVWEGAESMSVEQMLTFIEDDVREKGFNPDDFNL